jgi:hypothetical protein
MELSDVFGPYRRDLTYAFPLPGAVTEYEASTRCSYLELLRHSNGSGIEAVCNEGSLDGTNLSSWLAKVWVSLQNCWLLLSAHMCRILASLAP